MVGAGHTHLELLRRGALGAHRKVLIDPGAFWYSGLATGMLGGRYRPAEDCVDVQRFALHVGADYIKDRVIECDPQARVLSLQSGRTLEYQVVSFNLGSEVNASGIRGAEHGVPIKPISNLAALREKLEQRFREGKPTRAIVVGGGPSGVEIAANLRALGNKAAAQLDITIIARSRELLPQIPASARKVMHATLDQLNLKVLLNSTVDQVRPEGVGFSGGALEADFVVLASGLNAPEGLNRFGLSLSQAGDIKVTKALQAVDQPDVFAVGDCAQVGGHDLPKLGVFGVRQAPVLGKNLRARIEGRALADYHPQKNWLYILNMGDGRALAVYGRYWSFGRVSMLLKHFLDKRFMNALDAPSCQPA